MKKDNNIDNIINIRDFLFKIRSNWFYFFLSISLSILFAYGYTRYSQELFESSIKFKVYTKSDNTSNIISEYDDSELSHIKDEIQIVSSYPIVYQTIKDLRFDISYFIVGNIKKTETYRTPIIVTVDTQITQNNPPRRFDVKILSNEKYIISDKQYKFGDEINIGNYYFTIDLNNKFKIPEYPMNMVIQFSHFKKISRKYQSKLQIKKTEKDSEIIELYILEEDQRKGDAFLNQLVLNYEKEEIKYRRKSYINTINMIEKEFRNIRDSLFLIEANLESFQTSLGTTDLIFKTKNLYQEISSLTLELSDFKHKLSYYKYLEDYIKKGDGLDIIVSPSTYGIENSSLTELVDKMILIQLEKNVLIDGGQINNPKIDDFNIELKQISIEIQQNINISKESVITIIHDLNKRIDIKKSSLRSIPLEERGLRDIERTQKTMETTYTSLLKNKTETQIRMEAVTSNIRVINPAEYYKKDPVIPNKRNVYLIAISIGIFIPLLVLLIIDLLNSKIKSRKDLMNLTQIELIGVIGRNYSGRQVLTKINAKSSIAEGFRALRSNLNYSDSDNNHQVYLITSSVSGEGKTFVAANLGIVYANSNKKTLLLGADLRKPKLFEAFNVDNYKGLSSFLQGKDKMQDIIFQTDIENLDVIPSGELPLNPSDLFIKPEFSNMLDVLKKKYDKIVIDTAPIGLVADAYMLMRFTDVTLYMVRQDFTHKNLLHFVNELYEKERINNLYLVLNDVSSGSGVYGYGAYGYGTYGGYTYGYSNSDAQYFEENT